MKANIFEIKRFAVHDGDGIRTTVFFKGCPLKCVWCHNPEGIAFRSQLAYYAHHCISCGECVSVCPRGAHSVSDAGHSFARERCISCGLCESACAGGALKLYGKEMTVEELLPLLLADREFYESSGGGVTLSGGECLMQADFCKELLKCLKESGINTAVDTCGLVPRSAIDKVMPYTDVFLYDIKAYDEDVHIRCTGHSNKQILENLRYIDETGKRIEIRIPYVPELNAGELGRIAELLSSLRHPATVRALPYHNYAGSKYAALGMENTLPPRLPEDGAMEQARALLREIASATVLD